MAHTVRRLSTVGRGNILAPTSSDASVLERQEAALFNVREKLMGRQESCSAIVLSASTLSRTIMSTQMQGRGWSVSTANHLADATAIMHAQIAKATARGLSVARVAESGGIIDDNSPHYSSSGFRIKFASSDAVARLVVVDCFAHEPLQEVVRHIRLLDEAHKLNTVICFLTTPRPTEGQGFVIAPKQLLTLADAYERGVDLVIPTHFDQSVVEFLTEVFLSSSGRYMKGGGTSATTSNFSQIRSLLLDVTDRNHNPQQHQLHQTKDITGGVPNLEGFAVTSRKIGLDEDRLEEEVTEAQRREEKKRELKRQFLLQREKAANAIDTNPEYISLLSKYEICLRQLSSNKDKMLELHASLEGMTGERDALVQVVSDEQAEVEKLKNLISAYQGREESAGKERGTPAFHTQLVQREQRIAVLEKEAAGFKAKFEATKKQADEAVAKIERVTKDNEEAKRHILNLNKRFENRLRALGVTGTIDLDEEVHKHNEEINNLRREVYRWTRRTTVMRQRIEAAEVASMEQHDVDGFGRTAGAIIGGLGQLMSKDQMRELLNARKTTTYSTPQQASLSASPPKDLVGLTPPLQTSNSFAATPRDPPIIGRLPGSRRDEARMSVVSVSSDPPVSEGAEGTTEPTDSLSFLTAFGGMSAMQFSDMSAPATSNDKELCDFLVKEASKAVSEGDAVIQSVRQQQKSFTELRHHQNAENVGLGKIRTASMFADPQLARRRLSPDTAGTAPSDAAVRWVTTGASQRAEETLTSLQSISDRITNELSALVQAAEQANRNEEQNKKHLDVAIHDFMHLSRAAPVPTYEVVLQKLRTYTAGEVQKRERLLGSGALRSEELEKVATEFARWHVIQDEVDEKISSYVRSRESGSQDQRRREQLEQQLEVLEAKAMRLIPELSITRDPSNYVATQKEIFVLRRELKKLPGGRLKVKRGAVSPRSPPPLSALAGTAGLADSMSSNGSGAATTPAAGTLGDEPLSIFEVAEKALNAQLEATRVAIGDPEAPRHAVHRRSTALVGELQSLQSVMAQSGALIEGSFQSADLGRQAAANLNSSAHDADNDTTEKPFSTPDRETPLSPPKHATFAASTNGNGASAPGNGGAMHSVAAEMLQRFRSYSVVKKSQLTQPSTVMNATASSSAASAIGLKDLVGGIKTMVQAKLEAAQENVQQLTQNVKDDVRGFIGDTQGFGELNFKHIEQLFEQTKDMTTPTVLYQLILVYHKDLVRLLRQLRRRTSLTSVNIIDAHHLQKQLLKDNRQLTKAQADNIPFILSVDAAQVARFADYFERETEMLVKEGISRLQRHVEEVSAKNLNVDLKALHVADNTSRARSTSISDGAPTATQSPGTTSLPLSSRASRRPSMDTRVSKELVALPLKVGDELSFAIPIESIRSGASSTTNVRSPVDQLAATAAGGRTQHVEVAQPHHNHPMLPTHEPLSARRPSADEVHQSTAQLLGMEGGLDTFGGKGSRMQHVVHSAMRMGSPRLAGQAVLTTTMFGSPSASSGYEGTDPHRVIYLPRTPAVAQPTRPALTRKHEMTTSRQKLIDDAMQRIVHSSSAGGGGGSSGAYLPDWSSRIPPPSRQRMLMQQQQQK